MTATDVTAYLRDRLVGYDDTDREGRPIECGACDGTGKDQP